MLVKAGVLAAVSMILVSIGYRISVTLSILFLTMPFVYGFYLYILHKNPELKAYLNSSHDDCKKSSKPIYKG